MADELDMDELRRRLTKAALPQAPSAGSFLSASVFLPLFDKKGHPHLLAVLKADTEGYPWRNQVALPGGHVDAEDPDSLAAAYREIKEELGLLPANLDVIGSIGHFQTIRQTEIEAFVVFWKGNAGRLDFDRQEIARVLEIPIQTLVQNHVSRNFCNRIPGMAELIYPFGDDNVVIWGVTARIVHFFIEHLRQTVPEWVKLQA
ncbi:MAG: NUDIX hydrolase [Thermodesulfobacteriota bacterium]